MKKIVPFDPKTATFPCEVLASGKKYTCVAMFGEAAIVIRVVKNAATAHEPIITHAWPIGLLSVEIEVPMVRRTFYVYKQGVSRYQVYDCYIEQELLGGASNLCGSFNITIDPDTGKIVEVGLP